MSATVTEKGAGGAVKRRPSSLPEKLSKLRLMVAGHGRRGILLMAVLLAAAVAETLGLAVVLPLLTSLLDPDASGEVGRGVAAVIQDLLPSGAGPELLLALLVAAFVVKTALQVAARGLSYNFAMTLREHWTARIFARFVDAPYARIVAQRQGVVIQNMVQETYVAAKAVTQILEFINRLIVAAALILLLLFTQWQITAIIALIGFVLIYAIRRSSFRYAMRFGRLRLNLAQNISDIVAESVATVRQIKAFDAAGARIARLSDNLHRHTRAETAFIMLSELPYQLTELLVLSIVAGVLFVMFSIMGMAPTDVIAMLGFFVLVSQRLITYVTYVVSRRMKIAANLPSLSLVHDMLAEDWERERVDIGEAFPGLRGDVVFEKVGFAYDDGPNVLGSFNLTIPNGATVALVGPSGVGKSTVANLLMGLFRPTSGAIRIDDTPIDRFSLRSLRAHIGYVAQEAELFNASIRDNIAIGRPDASDADIEAAARIAHADEFVRQLPDGYDTVVGDRGVKLSGGQRQRLAIARAVIRQPDLYIFDEAASALDAESEAFIRDSIAKLGEHATILIIAHRLTSIEHADAFYKLEPGGRVRRTNLAELAG